MKRTKLSVLLAFLASLALAVFLAAQQPATSDQPDQGSQPAAQSQSDSGQQAQPAQSTSSDQSAQSADQSTQGQSDTGNDMPKTASDLPLVALLGVGSLGAGLAAHRYSRRYSER